MSYRFFTIIVIMVFEIVGKVALVTGGASGLGFRYAEELLKQGLKAVVLVDCDSEKGKASEENLNEAHGEGRALFVKTDVSDMEEFENAFNETIKHYDHVDILINNAGIMDDSIWEREISVNMKGNIHGLILGMEKFLKTYRQSEEAVIVNISSVCGIECYGFLPVYCSIKLAIIGMSRAWGCQAHYENSKIRVLCLCPGATDTKMMQNLNPVRLIADHYSNTRTDFADTKEEICLQKLDVVAEELVRIIKYAKSGSIWIVENDQPAYQYEFSPRADFRNNTLKEN